MTHLYLPATRETPTEPKPHVQEQADRISGEWADALQQMQGELADIVKALYLAAYSDGQMWGAVFTGQAPKPDKAPLAHGMIEGLEILRKALAECERHVDRQPVSELIDAQHSEWLLSWYENFYANKLDDIGTAWTALWEGDE